MKILGTSLDPLLFWKNGNDLHHAARFATSSLATLVRAASGSFVRHLGARPERRLVLYEMENCPYSRKVREALSILDLDADVRPCPKGGKVHRAELEKAVHVEAKVPVLLDPNNGEVITDSDKIVKYLFDRYGDGHVPLTLRAGPVTTFTSKLASALRQNEGTEAEPAKRPELPLHVYGYEASPYTRLVREVLCRYEIPYVMENRARNSPRRTQFLEEAGKLQFPYLFDPNNNTRLFQSEAIIEYVNRTYGKVARASETRPTSRTASAAA